MDSNTCKVCIIGILALFFVTFFWIGEGLKTSRHVSDNDVAIAVAVGEIKKMYLCRDDALTPLREAIKNGND